MISNDEEADDNVHKPNPSATTGMKKIRT